MPSTWYEIGFGYEIQTVQVERVTESMVELVFTDNYSRWAKKTSKSAMYVPTWEQAHQRLLRRAMDEIKGRMSRLRDSQTTLKKVSKMKPPRGSKKEG